MNINDLTIGQAKELSSLFGGKENKETPFVVGEKYFFRTVTHAQTGRVKEICGDFLILESAAWIADTGRFYDALKSTEFDEVEPFTNDCGVNINSIVDYSVINGDLPVEQK